MGISKIDVFATRTGYQLCWVVDGEQGAAIGETKPTRSTRESPAQRELRIAYETAIRFVSRWEPRRGFEFESRLRAMASLRAVRAALRADLAEQANKPWPAWAKQASAAGWKPPRGWRP